jgi:hypothetical protein
MSTGTISGPYGHLDRVRVCAVRAATLVVAGYLLKGAIAERQRNPQFFEGWADRQW